MHPLPPQHRCQTCDLPHWTRAESDKLNEHHRRCAHCRKPLYYEYMLKAEVWEQTGLGYHDGTLHLPCVEERIGRPLTLDDFNFSLDELPRREGQTINDAIAWACAKLKP